MLPRITRAMPKGEGGVLLFRVLGKYKCAQGGQIFTLFSNFFSCYYATCFFFSKSKLKFDLHPVCTAEYLTTGEEASHMCPPADRPSLHESQ